MSLPANAKKMPNSTLQLVQLIHFHVSTFYRRERFTYIFETMQDNCDLLGKIKTQKDFITIYYKLFKYECH